MAKAIRLNSGEVYVFESMWQSTIDKNEGVLLSGAKAKAALQEYRVSQLLKLIKPKDTLTTVCTHTSSNGMLSRFKVLIPVTMQDGSPYIRNITTKVAEVCGMRLSKHNEIIMGGYGYSKSFQIGYSLGRVLWPVGTDTPHGKRNGAPDSDGGYAIGVVSI